MVLDQCRRGFASKSDAKDSSQEKAPVLRPRLALLLTSVAGSGSGRPSDRLDPAGHPDPAAGSADRASVDRRPVRLHIYSDAEEHERDRSHV